jgi:hypothetical protein
MTVETLGRAYDVYRRTATSRSAVLLLLANVIPLVGVVFFGWSLLTILVLYWLENGIVGVWNVPKIIMTRGAVIPTVPDLPDPAAVAATGSEATAQGRQILGPNAAARLAAIPRTGIAILFAFHYGMFWLVHGIFVFALPAFGGASSFVPMNGGDVCFDPSGFVIECRSGAFGEVVWPSVLIGGIALFLSHGASFFLNYIGRGEYLTASPGRQVGSVYGRVVVLHLTILFGAFVVAFLGSPIGALLVLVVLKTAFDLGLHLRERGKADARIPADTAQARAMGH